VSHSEDLLHPGECVFIPNREPIRRFDSEPLDPPLSASLLPFKSRGRCVFLTLVWVLHGVTTARIRVEV